MERARLVIPSDRQLCPEPLRALIASCWNEAPKERPSSLEVQQQLEACMEAALQQHQQQN